MKNNLKKLFLLFCVLGLIVVSVPAEAAAKPKLSTTAYDISLGTSGIHKEKNRDFFSDGKHQVTIENYSKSAKYTVTTSNKAIAKASVSKNKINLTGIKAGSATITCKQVLKGKTTTVGKVKVTVHNAKIGWYCGDMNSETSPKTAGLTVINVNKSNADPYAHAYYGGYFITWASSDKNVKYKFSTDKNGLTVSLGKEKDCMQFDPNKALNTTPKKAGTYKVTMTQTYKKKSVKSSAKSTYVNPKVKETAEFYVGQNYYVYDFITKLGDAGQFIEWDETILDVTKTEDGYLIFTPMKAGTTELKVWVWDKKAADEKGEFLGTCKVTLSEVHIDYLEEPDLRNTYVGEYDEEDPMYLSVYYEPSYAIDTITLDSSDPSVVKLIYKDNEWYALPLKAGTVTITATTSNGLTSSSKMTVYANEDDYYDNY